MQHLRSWVSNPFITAAYFHSLVQRLHTVDDLSKWKELCLVYILKRNCPSDDWSFLLSESYVVRFCFLVTVRARSQTSGVTACLHLRTLGMWQAEKRKITYWNMCQCLLEHISLIWIRRCYKHWDSYGVFLLSSTYSKNWIGCWIYKLGRVWILYKISGKAITTLLESHIESYFTGNIFQDCVSSSDSMLRNRYDASVHIPNKHAYQRNYVQLVCMWWQARVIAVHNLPCSDTISGYVTSCATELNAPIPPINVCSTP